MALTCEAEPGSAHPLGITTYPDGVNFSIFSQAATDVVLLLFDHTDEGNELGPMESFRGIDNRTFYLLDPDNRAVYANYSGVGNTFNANHPLPQKVIVDCLRYWVEEMHVDGFRFDDDSILARGEDGLPLVHPPVIWQIELEDTLADTKLIAEAWDAAGLYQVGHFPGDRWAEWNGRYRDDVRRFVKGDPHFYSGETNERGLADIAWHGRTLGNPRFDDPQARTLACTIGGFGGDGDLHVMMNMFWEPLDFEVPVDPQRVWHLAIDTFAGSPHDIEDQGMPCTRPLCTVQGRSIVVLVSSDA